jgi:CelD/BcsL family acetyltransferase involved in cellulose biosynthesis
MIQVRVQPLDLSDRDIGAEWHHLEKLGETSFFTSWDWTSALLHTLPAKSNLLSLRLSKQSETVGLAFLGKAHTRRHLVVSSRQLHFNSPGEPEYNCLTTEDNLLLARSGLETDCWNAILRWFAQEQDLADELILPGLKQPISDTDRSNHQLIFRDIPVQSFHVDLTRLKSTGGRFADLLSKNARQQLRRSIRAYGGPSALELAVAKSAREALAWFDNMKTLHINSWSRRGKPHSFSRPFFELFHKNLIKQTFGKGRIQMLRINADGHPIGYLYNFRDGPRTYAYQSGFLDQDRRLRPGAVSHALSIEYNFRNEASVYDFMAGKNRLKTSFATDTRDIHWTTVQFPRVKFRLENLARKAKHGLMGPNKVN